MFIRASWLSGKIITTQQTADVHSLDRCEFFLSSLKCNAHALRLPRSLGEAWNLFCIFPCGHWIRANIQCGHRRVVCLFKQETPESVRWPLWKLGRNPTTRHRNIARYPARYIYRHPATIALLSSGGLLGPTDQWIFGNFLTVSSEKALEAEPNAVYPLSISFLVPEI